MVKRARDNLGRFTKAPPPRPRDALGRFSKPPKHKVGPSPKRAPAPAPKRKAPPPKPVRARDSTGRFLGKPVHRPDGSFAPAPLPARKRGRGGRFERRLTREELQERWDAWSEKIWERQPTAVVNVDGAIDAGIDPEDPRALSAWQLLHHYADTDAAEVEEWDASEASTATLEHWGDTGQLPPQAAQAPGRYDVRRRYATPAGVLTSIFSVEWLQVSAVRWQQVDPEEARGVNSYVKAGDTFVERRRRKSFAALTKKGKRHGKQNSGT